MGPVSPHAPRVVPLLPLLVLVVAHHCLTPSQAATVKYTLTLTEGLAAPDCVQKQAIFVNGDYPGPTLTGTEGDTMEVTVINNLVMEATSIHWHGIRMLNNNLNDGTAHVTQCPILPTDTFKYKFKLDKAGTYMYHGHSGIQKTSGLYGVLIVKDKKPPFQYDEELSLILNDWYHLTATEQVAVLKSGWVGQPQSILLNGKGAYNCSLVPSGYAPVVGDVKTCDAAAFASECGREVLTVAPGKTYRLRVNAIMSLVSLNLVLEGHSFTVVAADAYQVQPFTVGPEGLDLYTGQTVDIIFTATKSSGNYWIRAAVFGTGFTTQYGLGILNYQGTPVADPSTPIPALLRAIDDMAGPSAQAVKYKSLLTGDAPTVGRPKKAPEPLVLVNSLQFYGRGLRNGVNNVSLVLPSTPYALGLARGKESLYAPAPSDIPFTPWNYTDFPPTPLTTASNYYTFKFGSYVDIVLQNSFHSIGGPEEVHPWHMHGHNFWVLAYGSGTFNASQDTASFNLVDPPFRFTVPLFPYGWTALRFKVDNPGAWLFHCHIEYHILVGLSIVFVDGFVLPLDSKTRLCGELY